MTEKEMKIELGMEMAEVFERRKQAVYSYIAHVYGGGDVHETPDGASWYNHDVSPFAQRIVNEYRKTKDMKPNPFHPARKVEFKAFDRLAAWELDDGWAPAGDIRRMIRNAQVESTFPARELEKHGWLLDKLVIGSKRSYKLIRIEGA